MRCDEIAAELTHRSIPFVVTAGLDCQRQALTPADIEHFQIKLIIERLDHLLCVEQGKGPAGLSDETLLLTMGAKDDERTAA
jgi:hypothetical protein